MIDKYGNILKLSFPGQPPIVLTIDPEDIKTVYAADGKYPIAPFLDIFRAYRKGIRSDLYPNSGMQYLKKKRLTIVKIIFLLSGGLLGEQQEGWHKIRSVVQQDMLRPKSAYYYIDSLQDVLDDFLRKTDGNLNNNKEIPGDWNKSSSN